MSSDVPSQEEQLRQALELMGGRKNSGGAAPVRHLQSTGPAARHRYVRDGEVPVVHAALGRPAAKPDLSAQHDKALAEFLRTELERERAAREAAERQLGETRASLTGLQTRLAHLEMDLQAAQEQAAAHQALAQQALAQQALTQQVAAPHVDHVAGREAVAAPVTRKPRQPQSARVGRRERAPEPVKWWIKQEKP